MYDHFGLGGYKLIFDVTAWSQMMYILYKVFFAKITLYFIGYGKGFQPFDRF